jgi:hypothetical protein
MKNLKAATIKQNIFKMTTTKFDEYNSEKSGRKPKNVVNIISKGDVIICKTSRIYYNSSGYTNPAIEGDWLFFSSYQILSIIGSSESILLINFSAKISLILFILAFKNIFFNLLVFYYSVN